MNRADLAHILRAAGDVTGDRRMLVIGSQAILASYDEAQLPDEATRSIEADVAFFDDPEGAKGDKLDGAIGEVSMFQERFGVYGQGVAIDTATLPLGWEDRLVRFEHHELGNIEACCLEAHDLVLSKLVAGRAKDREFAKALVAAGLVEIPVLESRIAALPVVGGVHRRLRELLRGLAQGRTTEE